ncbi:DUF2783 domain-containing protein [Emcibacter nanhaiensis]|uniref:DUF2783 domain-containing protein n=1 Tax=Emcibacter nanhaiensis TaxID=1505037 RepID=A0A501PGQ2_9PROT|nr:DUF2783 domain-containing protein [Emcibacter nanhaiensis]TPD59134.1 DUF2783 domain-containing protein [Emcibacter nanhaiensis]
MPLNMDANIKDPDAFYQALIQAHEGLSDEESQALNARLIIVLANQVGDKETLAQALELAKTMEAPAGL